MKKTILAIAVIFLTHLSITAQSLKSNDSGINPQGLILWVGASGGKSGVYVMGNSVTWGGKCVPGMGFCLQFLSKPTENCDYISINKDLSATVYINKTSHTNDLKELIKNGAFVNPSQTYLYPQIIINQKLEASLQYYIDKGSYKMVEDKNHYTVYCKLTSAK